MEYTALIIAQDRVGKIAKKGKISAIKPTNHIWGKMECEPNFKTVNIELRDEEEKEHLLSKCYYDFDASKFRYREDDIEFVSSKSILRKEYVEDATADEFVETNFNNGVSVDDTCALLYPKYITTDEMLNEQRHEYVKAFRPYRDLPGVLEVMKLIAYGGAAEIYKAFKGLSQEVKDTIITEEVLGKTRFDLLDKEWKI